MSLIRFSPPLLCWFAFLGAALANPIAIVGDQRLIKMTAEDVVVTVSPKVSTVSGTYTFRQEKDLWPEEKDTHVLIYVPVLFPDNTEAPSKKSAPPMIWVGQRQFRCEPWSALSPPVGRDEMPKGWSFGVFWKEIPLHLVRENFTIVVKYVQPNFPGQRAGYIPMLPPEDVAKGRITFRPADGYALRPAGFSAIFGPKSQEPSYHPKDRQLLTVKLVKR